MEILLTLTFYLYVLQNINYPRVSVLKQHPFIISLSCRSESSTVWVGSLLRSQGAKIKKLVRLCFIQVLWGKIRCKAILVHRNSSWCCRIEILLAVGQSSPLAPTSSPQLIAHSKDMCFLVGQSECFSPASSCNQPGQGKRCAFQKLLWLGQVYLDHFHFFRPVVL